MDFETLKLRLDWFAKSNNYIDINIEYLNDRIPFTNEQLLFLLQYKLSLHTKNLIIKLLEKIILILIT